MPAKPHIEHCRSPDMETFTCWWSADSNATEGLSNTTYTLTYTIGKVVTSCGLYCFIIHSQNGPRKECPDYETGGRNSCFFDRDHTVIWWLYCLNVTAQNSRGSQTSEEHCLDVADIVEPDPPVNLTYRFANSSEEGAGRTVVVAWRHPNTADVEVGWLTLVYELQFRRESESHGWKARGLLREPRLELLDLPVGSYAVRVRCKSRNSALWSKWSRLLTFTIPPRQSLDKMLALILVTGVGVMAFLIIGFGIVPQSKRIKAFLLPPIPKPRIRGIDPVLLKKGKIDEINRLFSSFHGYSPPQYKEDAWFEVSADEGLCLRDPPLAQTREEGFRRKPSVQHPSSFDRKVGEAREKQLPAVGHAEESEKRSPGEQELREKPTWGLQTPMDVEKSFEAITHPTAGYSVLISPARGTMDFYTCVNGVSTDGTVHLVPHLPDHRLQAAYREIKASPGGADDTRRLELSDAAGRVKQAAQACSRLPGGAADSYTTVEALRLQPGVFAEEEEESPARGGRCDAYLCAEQNELAVPLLPPAVAGKM
ncbi:GHR protein, partial [Atractosteus spatula]|nr:GHR protein [Atractosteus spatula]